MAVGVKERVGNDVGSDVVGNDVGTGIGTDVGAHVCVSGSVSQQGVPKSFDVVTVKVAMVVDSTATSVGKSPQSLLEEKKRLSVMATSSPSCVGRGPLILFF